MAFLVWTLVIALSAIGLIGVVFPAVPGTPLIFAATWLAAWWGDYTKISSFTVFFSLSLSVLSLIIDFIATLLGTKRVGASKYALLGAGLGLMIGIFFFIPGMIIGPFIGAILGECLVKRDLAHLGKVGLGTWLGLLIGTVLKTAIAFSMIGLLIFAIII